MEREDQLKAWEQRYKALGISAESLLKNENVLLRTVLTGSVDDIRSVLSHSPHLLEHCDDWERNLICYAAFSGQVEVLEMVLEKCPELKSRVAVQGRNSIFCCAFASGNQAVIDLIIKHYAKPKGCRDIYVAAACTGSVAAIKTVTDMFGGEGGQQMKKILLIQAAKSGSVAALEYMMQQFPNYGTPQAGWRYVKDEARGGCLMHWIAESASVPVFEFMLDHYSDFIISKTADRNRAGDSFIMIANRSHMNPTFGSLVDLRQNQATQALNTKTPCNYNLLNSYYLSWQWRLINDEFITLNADVLEALCHNEHLSEMNRLFIKRDRHVLALKALNTKAKMLDLSLLRQLLQLAKNAISHVHVSGIFKKAQSPFIAELKKLIKHVAAERHQGVLNARQLAALLVIIYDAEHHPSRSTFEIDLIFIKKLRATATIQQQLNPRSAECEGDNIAPENFAIHFDKLKQAVATVALSDEVRRIIDETIMPGIEHLLTHQDQIVKHITEKFGVLYYLDQPNKKLPMHTDHVPSRDPQENRDTLNRVLINLFGAFYRVRAVGQLVTFFDKLTDGYCLEGRVTDVFNWAATEFPVLKSFHNIMRESVDKYLGYRHYVDGKEEYDIAIVEPAAKFIMHHLDKLRCEPHPSYAPDGEITYASVANYLGTILEYDTAPARRRLHFLC